MNTQDAVDVLIKNFPTLVARVDRVEDLFEMPQLAYDLLAEHALAHKGDPEFVSRFAGFIDLLAESRDDFLEELLVVGVLEGIGQDELFATYIRPKLGERGRDFWDSVEEQYFRRDVKRNSL